MNRYSENYVMTAYTESAADMMELETIRKTVKIINNTNKWLERTGYPLPRYRVKCQGRGPRTPFAKAVGRNPRAFDQSLPLKFAERMDVYVYERT